MTSFSHSINGNDFERAGSATAALKDLLKSIGVDAQSLRRAVIAAYEAELNVVIHAHHGTLCASILDHQLDVEVADEGPGIADVSLALQPGYSTAPEIAQSLGFGAGLGLPNIQRHADAFSLDSTVGSGCLLRFSITFCPEVPLPSAPNSLRIVSENCRACLRCAPNCPTQALRVRGRGPTLLAHRCIDCTLCIGACPTGAIEIASKDVPLHSQDCDVLIVSAPFLADFGPAASPKRVIDVLRSRGFDSIELLTKWERAQREALEQLVHASDSLPLLSPFCPVVVNLIETRFPSLLKHLAPLASPLEAAEVHLHNQRPAFLIACPAQHTRLREVGVPPECILQPRTLRRQIDLCLATGYSYSVHPSGSLSDSHGFCPSNLTVSGMPGVLRVLEALETGRLEPIPIIDLFACYEGCFGSPVLRTPAALGRHRWQEAPIPVGTLPAAVRREVPFRPRSALRLDPDLHVSVRKLHRMAEALRSLPGANCARCGAPSCRAHAEDFVLGRVRTLHCQHPDHRRTS